MLSEVSQAQFKFSKSENFFYFDFSNLDTKGLVNSNDFAKFLNRYEINHYIEDALSQSSKLSNVEKLSTDELKFEFSPNSAKWSIISGNIVNGLEKLFTSNKARVFYYYDHGFELQFTTRMMYGKAVADVEVQSRYAWGFDFWGRAGDNYFFHADFLESGIEAKYIDKKNSFGANEGRIISRQLDNTIEFSEVNASLLYASHSITLGITKEKITLGEGYRSSLILSSKSPSFPAIYLAYKPTDWLKFYYMHGWLISNVVDSSRIYSTEFKGNLREVEKEKYFVMHALQIVPVDNLSITFGETMIYSDRGIFPGYFIPFIFFRSLDHIFAFGSGDSGNNGSFFGEMSYKPIDRVKAYASVFIDEFALSQALKGDLNRNQSGYTIGSHIYAFPVEDLSTRIEYTKILPWVYSNWIPSQTYRHTDFLLGHYIGQNADQIFIELKYYLLKGLSFTLWGEKIRQGGISEITNQYTPPGETFLYGKKRHEVNFGFNTSYRFNYNFLFEFEYKYSDVTDEDSARTPSWMLGKNNTFSFTASFGL